MENTINVRRNHEAYENASKGMQDAVNRAYKAARAELMDRGLNCYGDDRAEELVAAIMHYVISCNLNNPIVTKL